MVYTANMANAVVAPSWIAGRLIADRYDVIKELGAGGSSFVFLARDTRYNREVAIKILRPEIAGVLGGERFLREIQILASLQHPGILPLYDSGIVDNLPFFVTPYISGKSLKDRLVAETSLPIDDALRILREIGEAVDFAHAHGVVHRDIKPENVLLHAEHACLADFGIARAIDVAAGDQLTDSQWVIGTAYYMSPEQGAGETPVGPGSDIYSLGILAYEMLSGGVPFTGATPMAIQARKVLDPVPPLRSVRSTVSRGIEKAIRQALSVTAADRWASAAAFSQALSNAGRIDRPSPGTRRWVLIALAVLIVLAAVFGTLSLRAHSAPQRPPRVVVAEFVNMTGDRSLDYLGITAVDWLTEGLQRTGVISGVATESAIRASRFVRDNAVAGAKDPITTLASESGADIVVSGRIYSAHDSLEYQIQVSDAKNRNLLGAIGPIGTPSGDPLVGLVEVRSRLMGLLAARVDDRLGQFATGMPGPPKYEAYREFSLALDRYLQGDFKAATPLFEAAYTSDSSFAAPVLFGSINLSNQAKYREADSLLDRLSGQRDHLTPFQQAWLDYRRALMAGERHAALVAVRTLDSLNPATKATYNHGVEALENGFVEEAISTLRSLTPERGAMRGWIPYYEVTGSAYHIAGRFSDELSIGEEARRQYPDRMYALLPSIRSLAALDRLPMLRELLQRAALLPNDPYGTSLEQLYVEAGDELRAHGDGGHARSYYAKALDIIRRASEKGVARPTESKQRLAIRAAAERGLSLWPELAITAASLIKLDSTEADYRGILGVTLVHTGKRSEAVALRNWIENDRRPYRFGRAPVAAARIATALGTTDDAIADLSRAFAEGRQFDLWVHRDADFDTLRPIASFQKIVALRREH